MSCNMQALYFKFAGKYRVFCCICRFGGGFFNGPTDFEDII